jgi:hypothetical protein
VIVWVGVAEPVTFGLTVAVSVTFCEGVTLFALAETLTLLFSLRIVSGSLVSDVR